MVVIEEEENSGWKKNGNETDAVYFFSQHNVSSNLKRTPFCIWQKKRNSRMRHESFDSITN